jgi:predicted dehydrogenase
MIRLDQNRVTLYPGEFTAGVSLPGASPPPSSGRQVELIAMEAEERWATLAELADAIHERREPEASGRDNLRSLALVLGAVESAWRGVPVSV